ncbi:hypothetical protein [Nannocystis punicea]|uniref:Streptomycin biosynthesis enzyme StrG n=1 Tax=Nannocystis punicea TaxID=2995304 RepID=A0ABY7GVY5_9BACT|nr:hypothetical protein [Nannocystis poenicansa]WAS91139.1 hypothetical protein O0S08_33550 [Nannocystis poenicansa]
MVMAAQALADVDRSQLAREAGALPQRTHVLLSYDTARFPFAAVIGRDVYKVKRLERLHEYVQQQREREGRPPRLSTKDNVRICEMMARQPEDADFWRLYHGFMLRVLAPLVGRGISYTSHPKLRIHLPGTGSVSSFHHDICVTKRPDQVNFWLPFVDVDGGATIWLESDYGRADFAPVPVRYGQVLIFDGGYLGHGSVDNTSEVTRVSLDMRFSYKKATTRADGVSLMNRIIQVIDAKTRAAAPCVPAALPDRETLNDEEVL